MTIRFDTDRQVPQHILTNTVQRSTLGWVDLLVFFVGLSNAVYINVGGNLYLAEALLLILLPYLLYARKGLLHFGLVKWLLVFGLAWLLNQAITDFYRSTSTQDMLKGWALIGIFLTNFLSLYLLVFPKPRRIAIGLLGHALGLALQLFIQPTSHMVVNAWKFGAGYALTLLASVVIFFFYNKKPLNIAWWNIVLVMLALFSFYVRSRSLGGTTLLAAFVVWFRYTRAGQRLASRFTRSMNIALSFLLLLSVVWGIIQLYGFAAGQGYLGEAARVINQSQSSGDFGILLGGRREWLPAMYAVTDSPLLGYGSYARNTEYGQYLYELNRLGYVVNNEQMDAYLASRNFIPTHSHLLQGLVWAGLAGGVFWIFALIFIARSLISAYRFPNGLFIATIFMGFYGIWNVLFSPFSNSLRLQWAFVLITLLFAHISLPAPAVESLRTTDQ
ncbi:MAG: hypothetical protein HY864_09685 [Chloroflexi bacterium]|nr:hypothetical protein [Chloroflexota bacterium]